jgi:hypothetical protein
MAEITAQPDGSASITVTQADTTALTAIANTHLPFLQRAEHWFGEDVAPELKQAADFIGSLAKNPPQGSVLTVSATEAQALKGMLAAHIPDFQQVLAVVESPAVRSVLELAKALL